jgi:hypothetical protein
MPAAHKGKTDALLIKSRRVCWFISWLKRFLFPPVTKSCDGTIILQMALDIQELNSVAGAN